MKTGKNHQKFFVLPFQHCIALGQLKCIISFKIWIVRVSFYFLEKWIFHFETFFAILILKKLFFFFRSQCGRQQQNNIWGLTSVCSMLPESYSASAPKATKEGTAKSERQEFPKPRKTAINQPLGDLRITENCPTSFIRRSCSWNISIQNREGKRDGHIEKKEDLGSNLQKSVFFPKAFFALRNKFSDMAKISLVTLKLWEVIKMKKRHHDFVIGVLELWNEPIDQKSTD